MTCLLCHILSRSVVVTNQLIHVAGEAVQPKRPCCRKFRLADREAGTRRRCHMLVDVGRLLAWDDAGKCEQQNDDCVFFILRISSRSGEPFPVSVRLELYL
jgi:hypothetical protein